MILIFGQRKKNAIIGLMLMALSSVTGCASFGKKLKAFLGGKSEPESVVAKSNQVKYSDQQNLLTGPRRQYKRVTKQSLVEDSALEAQTGSLWVMEGQGAYLFAQNIVRMIGDPIAVLIEGDPKEQLQAKADVIRKLWAKFEERQAAKMRAPAEENKSDKDAKNKTAKDENSSDKSTAPPPSEPKVEFNIKNIPTRIIEKTVDGNYRIKGTQPLMIGPREYKVIVTGVVRAEDFSDDGLSATKLLDAKYDIVSSRRQEQDL